MLESKDGPGSAIKVKGSQKMLRVLLTTISLSLAGLHFGYYLAIFNPMGDPLLTHVYNYDHTTKSEVLGNINMLYGFGALLGASITGNLAETIGRRPLVFIYDFCSIMVVLSYSIKNIHVLYLVRLCSGFFGVGGYMLATVVQAELLPKKIAPFCNGFASLVLATSVFSAYMTQDIFSSEYLVENWRQVFCWTALIGILKIMLVLTFVRTDTPKYIIGKYYQSRDREERLVRVISMYNPDSELDEALKQCKLVYEKEKVVRSGSVWKLLMSRDIRKRLCAGILINVAQQMTGNPFFAMYSTDLFNRISGSGKQATFYLAISKIIGAVIQFSIVKYIGRKVNFTVGVSGQFIGMCLVVISVYEKIGFLAYIGICLFMSCFALGVGGSCFIFLNEILPPVGVSVSTALSWLTNSIIVKLLPILSDAFGDLALLFFFACCCLIILGLVDYLVIETKGKTESAVIVEYATRKYTPLNFK